MNEFIFYFLVSALLVLFGLFIMFANLKKQHNQITKRLIRINNEIRISRLNNFDIVWNCLYSANDVNCWPGDSKQYFAIYGEYSMLSIDELQNVDVKQFILERLNASKTK